MKTCWAYFNGRWIHDRDLRVEIDDLGFSMGVTATERLRTFQGTPFRQKEHTERMRRSLDIMGMPGKPLSREIDTAIREFVQRNRSLWIEGDDWSIMAFVTPGVEGEPTRAVHGFPLRFGDWAHEYNVGVELAVSDIRQAPANCWPPELKCRSRMHYFLADQQVQSREPGARALLLDQEGFLGECPTANLVLYRQDEGVVSPRMTKVLPGVSVGVVRELAQHLGIPFSERDLSVEALLSADEAWLASTSVCLLPVVRCEGKPLGSGRPGPVYQRFLSAWNRRVGVDIAQQAEAMADRSGHSCY